MIVQPRASATKCSQQNQDHDQFARLPDDAVAMIFAYAAQSHKDLDKFEWVCKRWQRVVTTFPLVEFMKRVNPTFYRQMERVFTNPLNGHLPALQAPRTPTAPPLPASIVNDLMPTPSAGEGAPAAEAVPAAAGHGSRLKTIRTCLANYLALRQVGTEHCEQTVILTTAAQRLLDINSLSGNFLVHPIQNGFVSIMPYCGPIIMSGDGIEQEPPAQPLWYAQEAAPGSLHGRWLTCVTSDTDGNIVSTFMNGDIGVWNRDGLLLRHFNAASISPFGNGGYADPVTCIAPLRSTERTPPDCYLVAGYRDCTAAVWNDRNEMIQRLGQIGGNGSTRHMDVVTCATQLLDERVATGSRDHTAIIWNWDGSIAHRLGAVSNTDSSAMGHTGAIRCMCVLPNEWIVTGANDHRAIIWKPNGDLVCQLGKNGNRDPKMGHTGAVTNVCVAPDGRIVTGGTDGNVIVWSINGTLDFRFHTRAYERTPIAKLSTTDAIASMCFLSDGKLVVATANGLLHIFSAPPPRATGG